MIDAGSLKVVLDESSSFFSKLSRSFTSVRLFIVGGLVFERSLDVSLEAFVYSFSRNNLLLACLQFIHIK